MTTDGSDLSHAMRGSLAGGAERIVHPWSADGDHSKRVVIRRSTSFVANAFVDHCKAPKTCPVEMTGQVRQMKVISFGWVGISPTLDQQTANSDQLSASSFADEHGLRKAGLTFQPSMVSGMG